ncbi:flagellar biosynthetic protein FlhB [Scopulibacillus daqui]|uniref:Flagellar biosynthetic protein FlhB n=1 Tax=Scopulibacillus daqui TaxID=1469162 RepID=A0ABS2PWE7_9BACL|nr:flagellar biosynthesis protein FlhB [Scopulibacillus daqui]MBM7644371.1 flagellar biosynthetic protein FlhB [Scopulibacillus daqui]
MTLHKQIFKLDLQFFSGEKTEKATPRKREETRKKGQTAKSADLNTAISLLAIFLSFIFLAGIIGKKLFGMMFIIYKKDLAMAVTEENIHQLFTRLVIQTCFAVAPVFAVSLVIGVAGNLFQTRFIFSPSAVQFKLERINPLKGFKRIYSIKALVELIKSLLKIFSIGMITFYVIWLNGEKIVLSIEKPVTEGLVLVGKVTLEMGLAASVFLIFLGALDYAYQKFDFEKSIRMSKQDIKDEYKKTEGDPLIKSKIKERQRQMAARRMMQEVPNADVIITNPTHFAVALKYTDGEMSAPMVIAKGADYLAFKIREIAKAHDIVIVEKRSLARALYQQLDAGDLVPEHFFKAVAEILAYVYRLKGKV